MENPTLYHPSQISTYKGVIGDVFGDVRNNMLLQKTTITYTQFNLMGKCVLVQSTIPTFCLITIHFPSLSLPSRLRTLAFFIIERSRSIVRVVTDKVSDILIIGRCKNYSLKLCWSGLEYRF